MADIKRLTKIREGSIISGVCSGLAHYLEVDSTIVRIIFILLVFFAGSGVVLYLVLWLFMPNEGQSSETTQEEILRENVQDIQHRFDGITRKIEKTDKRYFPGLVFILFAILLFLKNTGVINAVYILPTLLLVIGIYLLVKA